MTTQDAPGIAIIGAGIGGLACAHCLSGSIPGAKITVYDHSPAPGGRLKSVELKNDGGTVELGAGRFHALSHPRLNALVRELAISTHSFEYTLSPVHAGLFEHGRQLLTAMLHGLASGKQNWSAERRESLSFREGAAAILGATKTAFLVTCIGYDSLNHPEMSFADGMSLLNHHPETMALWQRRTEPWQAPNGGFQAVAERLSAQLAGKVRFYYRTKLQQVQRQAGRRDGKIELHFESSGTSFTAHADYLVLAMPMGDLQAVRGLAIPSTVSQALVEVPLTKMYLQFESRWWEQFGLSGLCLTLPSPFRKVYFPPRDKYLLVYCDGASATSLHRLAESGADLAALFSADLLKAVPGLAPLPKPCSVGGEFWQRGITFWKRGLRLLPEACWQLEPQTYYVSDLCTSQQGWIEGSLHSAQDAAAGIVRHAGKFSVDAVPPAVVE
jgi:monoamine oxidase